MIQSFVPEEVSFEEAHQVGIELCKKIRREIGVCFSDTYR
ncbi:hypothetical protein [Granulicatella elegans]